MTTNNQSKPFEDGLLLSLGHLAEEDRLLLSLSHAPLPTSLLNTLIDQASIECTSMLNSIEEIRNHLVHESQDEKKEQCQQQQKRNTTLHVLTTGTPYVIKPGKSQPDYIHQWTKGELILARLVEKIGMEKFHRVPKDGETKLAGRLIDVKPSDFEFILTHSKTNGIDEKENKSATADSTSPGKKSKHENCWRDDVLLEELSWIANNIVRILIIDKRPKIGCTKILFPLDPRFEHVNHDEIMHFIEGVFKKEWSQKDGPLRGAEIEVIIVKAK